MRKNLIILLVVIALFSCGSSDNPENNELIGKWQLIEVFSDPGDGSGSFNPVESDKTIEFKRNSTFISNGIMCNLSTESSEKSTGAYSIIDSSITPDNCNFFVELPYRIVDTQLIITHFCIEGCGEKYEKVD